MLWFLRNFLLVDGGGLYLYTYDGRLQSTPKWGGMRTEILNINTVSISNDTIAVRDLDQKSMILLLDLLIILIIVLIVIVFMFVQKGVLFFEMNGKPIGDGRPISHAVRLLFILFLYRKFGWFRTPFCFNQKKYLNLQKL